MVIRSINVGSSTGAFELLTRFETGQRCNKSSDAGLTQIAGWAVESIRSSPGRNYARLRRELRGRQNSFGTIDAMDVTLHRFDDRLYSGGIG
jgi:hypothetical protein